jgi:signal transduction histidine kinase
MRHRAAAIDGTINISGASGGGTAVTCQFPVEA